MAERPDGAAALCVRPLPAHIPDSIWIGFVLVQALDGVMTVLGIYTFGLAIEANPVIGWYAGIVGPEAAVFGAKLLAVACGVVLHLAHRHRTIAALALIYVVFAVAPWTTIFVNTGVW